VIPGAGPPGESGDFTKRQHESKRRQTPRRRRPGPTSGPHHRAGHHIDSSATRAPTLPAGTKRRGKQSLLC